ncbi:MAG: hypothetical protein AAFV43_02490 [Planctomycetota bacterium]
MRDPHESLGDFLFGFFGYGSLTAPTWFIGPEEAGANTVEGLLSRVAAWDALNRVPIVDIYDYGAKLGSTAIFEPGAAPQPTWRRLIEIALLLEGSEPTGDAIRGYQYERLGRRDGGILLAELMPCAKPSISSWPYAELSSSYPFLASLNTYNDTVRPRRVELLSKMLRDNRPQRVVFYGVSDGVAEAYEQIAGVELRDIDGDYRVGSNGATEFVAIKHPNARGKSRAYFLDAAALL